MHQILSLAVTSGLQLKQTYIKLYPTTEVMTLSYLGVFILKKQDAKIIKHLEIYPSLTQLARLTFFSLMIILNMS